MYIKVSAYVTWLCLNILFFSAVAAETEPSNIIRENTSTISSTKSIMREAVFQNALHAYLKEQFKEAELIFRNLLERYPKNPLILNNLAVTIAKQGKHDLAIRLLKNAIALNEILNTSYQNLSSIYAYEAVNAYRRALSLTIDSPEPLDLILIGHTDELIRSSFVTKQILQDGGINQPLVQEPEAPAAIGKGAIDGEIMANVMRWAKAWSNRNLNEYFASYRDGYAPSGKTHREWKKLRIQRLRTPQKIQVAINDVHIQRLTPDKVVATFLQNYRSNLLKSTVTKRLEMTRINDEWKITDEKVLR